MKNFLAFIKNPPLWFVVLACVLAFVFSAAAVAVMALLPSAKWAPAVYAPAAVFLSYGAYSIVRTAPAAKRAASAALHKNAYVGRFLDDYGVRTVVFALCASVLNAAYVAVNGATAIMYASAWYVCMTGYYLALMLVRGGVLYFGRRASRLHGGDGRALGRAKAKVYFGCGMAILALEAALVFAVAVLVTDDSRAQTGIVLAIATAAYTFYKFTLAIVNVVKAGRFADPAVQCFRNISLVDALVAMLSLQVTLMAVGGEGEYALAANAALGAAVCAVAAATGIVMIVRGGKKLKEYDNERQGVRQ